MTDREFRRLLLPLLAAAAVLMLAPAVLLNALSSATSAEIRHKAVEQQAAAVGTDLAASFQRAKAVGIPIREIPQVAAHLDNLLQRNPSFRFFALLDSRGEVLHLAGINRTGFDALLNESRADMRLAPRAARGEAVPVSTEVGHLSVTRVFLADPADSDQGGGELVYGVRTQADSPFLAQGVGTLLAIVATLLLLGLAALYGVARQVLLRPMSRLAVLFGRAHANQFAMTSGISDTTEIRRVSLLWNNEVASLQDRQSQLASMSRDAVAAADEPAVAREIERLSQEQCGLSFGVDRGPEQANLGQELRLPVLALAFIAGVTLGNAPDDRNAIAAAAGALAGILLAVPVPRLRQRLLARSAWGLSATAAFMLANAVYPLVSKTGMLDAALSVVAALLLAFMVTAGLLGQAGASLPRSPDAGGIERLGDRTLLLMHLVIGGTAAAIWTYGGPAVPGDTLEAWIGTLMMAATASLLWQRQ